MKNETKRNNANHPWKVAFSKKQRQKENAIREELKKTDLYHDLWPKK